MIKLKEFREASQVEDFFQRYPEYTPITIQHVKRFMFEGFYVWYKE